MRVAAAAGPGAFTLEERDLPEPGPGFARVRVLACGICGTDLHFSGAGFWPKGHVGGHEMHGEVDALGEGATGVSAGDRVAIEPVHGCGACPACRAGRANICPRVRILGISAPGGFAEAVCAPAERLYRVAPEVPPAIGALAEPMAVAVHGVRKGGLVPGQRVLVLGAGTIGLLSVLASRVAGAGEIWLTARHPHQAELGRALGADRVLAESEAAPLSLASLGADAPIDLVIETVGGSADTLRAAASAIRPGGAVSVVGVFMGDVAVPALPMLVKEGSLHWSNCYDRTAGGGDFAAAVALLARQRTALAALTTRQVPLADLSRGFAIAADKRAGAVKVTVLP
jgi:threonine dehydrogenase-like Zn-dependent dehydrogenase